MLSRTSARAIAGSVAFICLAALGCGGDKTYRISGKVTFKGQPIPAGKIYFYPDSAKSNTGPAGYADIKNGEYDTGAVGGRGTTGGPSRIAIEAWDPTAKVDSSDPDVTVKSLFPRYEVMEELPKSSGTKDFEVPASAVNPKIDPKSQPNPNDP